MAAAESQRYRRCACGAANALIALVVALVTVALTNGCSEAEAPAIVKKEPKVGGGPLVYLNNQLRWISTSDREVRFVARVTGFSQIEILSRDELGFHAAAVAGPLLAESRCDPPFPVAIAVLATGHDARVLVFDACGNWTVSIENAEAHTWEPFLPELPTMPYLEVVTFGTGDANVIGSNGTTLISTRREAVDRWETPTVRSLPAPFLGRRISTAVVALPQRDDASHLLVQSDARLLRYMYDSSTTAELTFTELAQVITPPFVEPYRAFDQLTVWPDAQCPPQALGIGLFDSEVNSVRRLQQINIEETKYSVVDLDDSDVSYVGLAIAQADARNAFVFAIGHRGQTDVATLWRRQACGDFVKLAEREVDFGWKGNIQTIDGVVYPIPRTDGISIIARWTPEEGVVALHYDGYAIRTFSAGPEDWTINEQIDEIHSSRDDYTFVD